jgi:hypothetical protein
MMCSVPGDCRPTCTPSSQAPPKESCAPPRRPWAARCPPTWPPSMPSATAPTFWRQPVAAASAGPGRRDGPGGGGPRLSPPEVPGAGELLIHGGTARATFWAGLTRPPGRPRHPVTRSAIYLSPPAWPSTAQPGSFAPLEATTAPGRARQGPAGAKVPAGSVVRHTRGTMPPAPGRPGLPIPSPTRTGGLRRRRIGRVGA